MVLKIQSDKLLIVEGTHEQKLFEKIFEKIHLSGVQILPIGGKTLIGNNLKILQSDPKFECVKAIGIVRDADEDSEKAIESVNSALRNANLVNPGLENIVRNKEIHPRISIFIAPNNYEVGSIEDLCLLSVCNDPIMNCVDNYFSCLTNIQGKHPHLSKAKVQVYLAKEEEGDVSMSTACSKDIWNLDHEIFNHVKDFLNNLYKSD
jgi:hypothetical protein